MINKYELVKVDTKEGLRLYGMIKEAAVKKSIIINMHGTASNFYEEDFIEEFAQELPKIGFSILSANNRGAYVYDAHQKSGAAIEKFEDCIEDIDKWIKFALNRGYKEIILSGHSLGTEKVVYSMGKGAFKNKVNGIILLAPSDSVGYNQGEGYGPLDREKVKTLINKAQKLIKEGKKDEFLDRYSYSRLMPKSAESFISFSSLNKEFNKALPFHKKELNAYAKIPVPILAVIGDQHEYTALPIKDALELMKKSNKKTEAHQIKDCNHDFEGKEKELTNLVKNFLLKNFKKA